MKFCPKCSTAYREGDTFCLQCGAYLKVPQEGEEVSRTVEVQDAGEPEESTPYPPHYSKQMQYPPAYPSIGANRRIVGLAAILAGPLGLHYFIMNKKFRGFLFLGISTFALLAGPVLGIPLYYASFIPGMIGILQGIRILCLTDREFAEIYYGIPPLEEGRYPVDNPNYY